MKIKKIFFLFCLSILLTGCVQKEIIDDVNIEMGIGYDLKGEDQIDGTILVPVFNPDKQIGNFMFRETASNTRDLLAEIQRKSPQPIVTGSLEIAVFGEEMARHGIVELIDSFERDPSIGAMTLLAVGEESAHSILSGDYGDRGKATHLSNLITHNTETKNLPRTNLHLFLHDFYQKGNDPYLPIMKKADDAIIDITGIALFKDEKMVDKITADKMFFFKLLADKFIQGSTRVKVGEESAAVRSLNSKNDYKLTQRNPYNISITIKIKGILREYTGKKLDPGVIKKIEGALKDQVNSECTALIASFQEQGIDPLGIGHFIRSKTRGFDFKKWDDDYKNMTFQIKTEATITEVGIVE